MLRNRLVAGFNVVYVKGEEDHRDFGSWEFNEDEKLMKMEMGLFEFYNSNRMILILIVWFDNDNY